MSGCRGQRSVGGISASRAGSQSQPEKLRIRVSVHESKTSPAFGDHYFRGNTEGLEGLDTSASLEEVTEFVNHNKSEGLQTPSNL